MQVPFNKALAQSFARHCCSSKKLKFSNFKTYLESKGSRMKRAHS